MVLELFIALLVMFAALNAWATRAVFRDELSSREQRIGQLAVVWFVPVLGALLTLYLKRRELESSNGCYREEQTYDGQGVMGPGHGGGDD